MSGRRKRAPLGAVVYAATLVIGSQGAQAAKQAATQSNPPASATPAPANPIPQVTPDRPVSLEEAIQIANQSQGRVAVAEENVEISRQRIREARVGTLPSIIGSVGYRINGQSNLGGIFGPSPTVAGPPGTRDPFNFVQSNPGLQPQVGLTYTPFNSGLTRTQVRQARANLEGSQANLEATRNNLAFTVTTNYLLQLRAQALLRLRHVQEDLAEAELRRVEARIAAGSAAAADRALVLSEYRNRQVDRILAENQVRVSSNTLRNSMGLPPGPTLQLVERAENRATLPPVETLREIARRNRPEVAQDEAAVRSAQAGQAIARIARKPRLDTSIVFDVDPNNSANRSSYAVGATVSLPLWDAGLTHAREMEARAQVSSSSAQLEQTKKDVAADVEEAYLNFVNAQQRLDAARLAVEAAQVNLEATTARYELGAAGTTAVDLVQAQVQFATASDSAIEALYDVHLAQAQLNRATGR